MYYTCELIDPKTKTVSKENPLTLQVLKKYDRVFSWSHMFGEKGIRELDKKVARDTIPLLVHCITNLELAVNSPNELKIVQRLREMATTEFDFIWSVYLKEEK